MKFAQSLNKNVFAVISEDHARLWKQIHDAGGDPLKAGVRIFTFCYKSHMDDPVARRRFTGTYEDLTLLIKNGGHNLLHWEGDHFGWNGYVPFSNGLRSHHHGLEGWENELKYVTTLRDVIDTFGLVG